MRVVADRHKLAAYHNKHCWRGTADELSEGTNTDDLELLWTPKI